MYEVSVITTDPKTGIPVNRVIIEEPDVINEKYISRNIVDHILDQMKEAEPILRKNLEEAGKRSGNFTEK